MENQFMFFFKTEVGFLEKCMQAQASVQKTLLCIILKARYKWWILSFNLGNLLARPREGQNENEEHVWERKKATMKKKLSKKCSNNKKSMSKNMKKEEHEQRKTLARTKPKNSANKNMCKREVTDWHILTPAPFCFPLQLKQSKLRQPPHFPVKVAYKVTS